MQGLCRLLVPIALATGHEAQAGPWNEAGIASDVTGVRSVALADVDGDGELDVITASRVADEIAWHRNQGAGTTWSKEVVSSTANGAQSARGVDLDGDGDVDVLAASAQGDAVEWFENESGDGTNWVPHAISTIDGAHMARAGDLDGDGDLDVVSTSATPGSGNADLVTWHEQDDSSWNDHTLDDTLDSLYHMSLADADIDGDPDIAVAATVSDMALYYENVDFADSWTRITLSASLDGARSTEMADLDGDGDRDIVVTARFADTVVWYENDAGSWIEHAVASVDGAHHAVPHDVDRDGDLDLALAAEAADTVAWIENLGGAATWSTHELTISADGARSVAVGDVDGDGDPDVVAGNEIANTATWFENQTLSRFPRFCEAAAIAIVDPFHVQPVDIDTDGDLDVVVGGGTTLELVENQNAGAGWTTSVIGPTGSAGHLTGLDVRDYPSNSFTHPGDGKPDITFTTLDGEFALYESDPWTLTPQISVDATIHEMQFIVGQFSSPFWSSFFAATWDPAPAGGGVEVTQNFADTGVISPGRLLSVADFDGDGKIDLTIDLTGGALMPSTPGTEIRLFSGWLWTPGPLPLYWHTTAETLGMVPADIDGDGTLDHLWNGSDPANPNASTIRWIDPWGVDWPVSASPAIDVAASDIDSDGDLDVLGVGFSAFWLENLDGYGGAWAEHEIADGFSSSVPNGLEIGAGDYDNDGDRDVFVASADLDQLIWYDNQHALAQQTVRVGVPPNPAVLVPDPSGAPVMGSPWSATIDHTSFVPDAIVDNLVFSWTPFNVPVPPYGTLLCNVISPPATLIGAPGQPFQIVVPTTCLFPGLSMVAQGASLSSGGALSLTNALDLVFGTYR